MSLAEPVESLSDPRAQRVADLAKPSHNNAKTVLIEDAEPLATALAAGVEVTAVYHDAASAAPPDLLAACARAGAPVAAVAPAILTRLFKTDKRPKLFGLANTPRPAQLADLADRPGDIVVLDGVRIVGNIGAIVRSAAALGAAGLALVDSGLATVADRRLLRASRGHVFTLPVALAEPAELSRFLARRQIPTALLDAGGRAGLADLAAVPGRRALIFGGEKTGPSARFRPAGGGGPLTVAIAMPGPVESLNVSVAVGIVLHALAALA